MVNGHQNQPESHHHLYIPYSKRKYVFIGYSLALTFIDSPTILQPNNENCDQDASSH